MTCYFKTNLFLITALALVLAGCHSDEKEPEPEVSVQAAPVTKADISRVVNAEAIIFPVAQAVITPKVSAPVRKFLVTRGQKVRKGQLLAELENRDLSAARLDNQGAYEQAQATYETSVGATLPEDIQKANNDVQTAQKALDAAQKVYSSRESLFQQGAIPRKELDDAAVALTQAQSQYAQAKKHLDSLNAIVKQQTLKSAQGQLTSAKGKYLAAEAQLSYTEIRSPIDGFITDRPLYPGEMASTSVPLLTVMDLSNVIAKAHIPQSDAMLLRNGDKATVTVPGLDPVPATVTVVSPALDPNSTTVEIWVQAKNPKQQLRPGTSAQVSITAQTVQDALVVPAAALLNASGNKAQVMVVDAQSKAQSRDVQTGIQSQDGVQIVAGLKPGEQVVTQGAYGLPDKTKVKIEKPAAADKEKGEEDKGKDEGKAGDKDKD
jgi:multidrug efflux pump subunit AcrA (membrane-fusion protein)